MIGPQNVSFSTHRPVSGRPVAIMAGLILIGAGLRFYQLTAKGLWADEIFTALFAGPDNDVATVIHNALSTPLPSPPLWFLITHLFVKVLGSNELVLRFPSVLAGTLCIPAIYMVGNELFNRRIALVGATLLAVSPIQIHFSQEARTYAAVVFLSLLGCLFFYRGLTRRQWRWWVGFSLVTLINLYLHLTAILVLASEVVIAFFFLNRPRRTQVLPVLASLMIILIGFSPMAPFLITGIQGPRGLGNITEIEGLSITIEGFLSLFGGLGAGTGVSLSLFL
ncbi:MAG: glycosyltransferase family 39 protein, partial [Anaerolineales bacterium]|nr:glycosyltransferase family 39 protein [Anaerolineales bacterium]